MDADIESLLEGFGKGWLERETAVAQAEISPATCTMDAAEAAAA